MVEFVLINFFWIKFKPNPISKTYVCEYKWPQEKYLISSFYGNKSCFPAQADGDEKKNNLSRQ